MIGPIFYILLTVLMVAIPAVSGWKLSQKHGQSIRMASTILAGQLILAPVVVYITFGQGVGANPLQTALIYSALALVISIATFVVLEIRDVKKTAKTTVPVAPIAKPNQKVIAEADPVEPQ